MGHTGSGKTTLVDAILNKLGISDRPGSVDAGTSMSDYTDAEKARKISISAKPFTGTFKNSAGKTLKLIFIDTPGYMDFFGQVICAAYAAECALVAVDATSGIQVGTRQVWRLCEKRNLPRAIVITGIDKENANFGKVLSDLQSIFGKRCAAAALPLPDKSGVVDVLGGKKIPDALASEAEAAKGRLIELAAETDDSLTEKFLEGKELTAEETANGLRKAVRNGVLVPVFACAAAKNIGLTELLDGVGRFFPSPEDLEVKDQAGSPIKAGAGEPFVGMVWRTVNDEYIGQLAFVRVLGGTLTSDSEVMNTSKNQKERIATLLCLNGKKQTTVPDATAGDIIALSKLKATAMGDTLCAPGKSVTCETVSFPSPVTYVSVKAKTQADEDKLGTALARVCEEDPTLKMERNNETRQTILSGLGDTHIDVTVERMKRRSNVEVVLDTPKVPYRETVMATGEGHYKHKKQSGGRGQYGEVYLRVSPKAPDDPDWFVDDIVGGAIPNNFVPAVQKGLVDGMTAGSLAGYPVTNVKISVYDGTFHEVDSCEIAFKIAGSRALKDGMTKAKPVLLEPIMTVRVFVPDQCMGDINGDLNHRRGRILGIGVEDGVQVITAEVPQSEMFRYAAELRSMTAGQGNFEMKFCRYDTVPSNMAQKVIAEAQKDKKEKDED
jgi:elongation factor G